MVTILSDQGEIEIGEAAGTDDQLWLAEGQLEDATGWSLKPEGLCRGKICLPLPAGEEEKFVRDGRFKAAAFWRHLGRPVLHDAVGTTWLLGTGAGERTERLSSLQAPDFKLPDLEGRSHTLAQHRGKKVLLATWASW